MKKIEDIAKDGETTRVPMYAMDSMDPMQRAIAATVDAMRKPTPRDEMISRLQFKRPSNDGTTSAPSATFNNPKQKKSPDTTLEAEITAPDIESGHNNAEPKTHPSGTAENSMITTEEAYQNWKKRMQNFWRETWTRN